MDGSTDRLAATLSKLLHTSKESLRKESNFGINTDAYLQAGNS